MEGGGVGQFVRDWAGLCMHYFSMLYMTVDISILRL